ncbi:MAG: 4Fe-4S dicluster domain-containing protein [Candidatus Bathyarchaeia archaeon]
MKKVLVPDPMLCTGCRSCEMECSLVKEGECNPRTSRIRVISFKHDGIDLPILCYHCSLPPCKEACPVEGAMTIDPNINIVKVNDELCIGCGKCIEACPFGAITLHPNKGKAIKCDLCGGAPKCIEVCVTKAVRYIDPEQIAMQKRMKHASSITKPTLTLKLYKLEV